MKENKTVFEAIKEMTIEEIAESICWLACNKSCSIVDSCEKYCKREYLKYLDILKSDFEERRENG